MRVCLLLALTSGCVARVYDPGQLAKAPTWVAELSHEQQQATGSVPTRGALRLVPPPVCGADCETARNRLAGSLSGQGVQLSGEATTSLVFREVSHQAEAEIAPVSVDLYSVDGADRTPFEAPAELGAACNEAAKTYGTVSGERLVFDATVQSADGTDLASWRFVGSDPVGVDLIYRTTQQPDKWGYVDAPRGEYNGTQILGTVLGAGGAAAAAVSIPLVQAFGGRWTRVGRDFRTVALVSVPAAIAGLGLVIKGNQQVQANPADVPAKPGFWRPIEDVFCVGATRVVPRDTATPNPPTTTALFDRAARHFADTLWETDR